jgi:hypothetical protein
MICSHVIDSVAPFQHAAVAVSVTLVTQRADAPKLAHKG